jgi:signal transduction histidine kinase
VAWQWVQRNTFAPSWLPVRWRHPVVGYVVAVLVQALAILLTVLLLAAFPWAAFSTALVLLGVVLVALNWGAGPSLVAAVIGVVLINFVVLPPRLVWSLASFWDGVALILLVSVGLAMSLLASSVERSKRHAEEERAEAQLRERALQRVHERMDEFVAIASHDLRSPLMAALGFNEIAARRYQRLTSAIVDTRPDLAGQVAAVRSTLTEASQSVERIGRLVDLLFDTTQVRAGKLELHPTPVDLAAVVRDQVLALRVAYPLRTLQLELPVEGPVPVVADADRIGQVVTNYVTNALKYSQGDQPVAIQVARDAAWARVLVADHGPGLPASEQERIWERFYQAEGLRVQSGSSGGLGLGLHICKTIVEGHGGAVGIESAVGVGSTFWFTLPLAEEASERM